MLYLVFLLIEFQEFFILNITSFSDMPFANVFFRVLPCAFILSPVPYEEEKFLKSTKSCSLSFVFFYGSGTSVASKKSLPVPSVTESVFYVLL